MPRSSPGTTGSPWAGTERRAVLANATPAAVRTSLLFSPGAVDRGVRYPGLLDTSPAPGLRDQTAGTVDEAGDDGDCDHSDHNGQIVVTQNGGGSETGSENDEVSAGFLKNW